MGKTTWEIGSKDSTWMHWLCLGTLKVYNRFFNTINIFNISSNKDLIIFSASHLDEHPYQDIYIYLRYFCQKEKLFSEETHFRGIIQRNTVQKYIEKYLVLEIMYADDYKVFIFWSRSSHFHKLLILQTF